MVNVKWVIVCLVQWKLLLIKIPVSSNTYTNKATQAVVDTQTGFQEILRSEYLASALLPIHAKYNIVQGGQRGSLSALVPARRLQKPQNLHN